jgi:hypothetical protein
MLYSPYPAERVAVEVQSRLGPDLSNKGFRVIASGPSGVTWRRAISGQSTALLLFLGLMFLGGIGSGIDEGDAGSVFFGVICGTAGFAFFWLRRPATVVVVLQPMASGGCGVDIHATLALEEVTRTVSAVASAGTEPDLRLQSAETAFLAGRIDAHEFEGAVDEALDGLMRRPG